MSSTAGDRTGVAAWVIVLAVACGRADNAQSSPLPTAIGSEADEPAAPVRDVSPTSDGGPSDAGDAALPSPDGAASFECPAPRPEAPPGDAAGWGRDPATGTCCPYANRTAAPNGWLRFDFEEDCNSRCLCSALEGFEGDFEDLRPVRDSLECRCSVESCPSTLEEAEQRLCAVIAPPAAVLRFVGCGMVMVTDRNGFSGYAWIFEQQPSESGDAAPAVSGLVGASQFSDAQSSDPCPRESWFAGRDFFAECDDAEVIACQLCGDSPGPDYPPCQ